MNRFTIVTTNLARNPVRTALTLLTLVVAFLLFMLLRAIASAFAGDVSPSQIVRLHVDAKYSMVDNVPIPTIGAIAAMPGIVAITPMHWFGGYYQEPRHSFAKMAVDHQTFFDVFPDITVDEATRARFMASKRGVIVADSLAREFRWRTGDAIPVVGDTWPRADGTWSWQFELAGTYTVASGSRVQPMMVMRFDYYSDAVMDWAKDFATWAVARVDPNADVDAVIASIDGRFANSADPMKAVSEDDYRRQFANQLGDMGTITTLVLIAVFFTLLLLTANVASLSFQERVPELGVLKTFGYRDLQVAALVMAEAILLCVAGAAIGVCLAFTIGPWLASTLELVMGRIELSFSDAAIALALAVLIGVIVALAPTMAARRLSIVDALRQGG